MIKDYINYYYYQVILGFFCLYRGFVESCVMGYSIVNYVYVSYVFLQKKKKNYRQVRYVDDFGNLYLVYFYF